MATEIRKHASTRALRDRPLSDVPCELPDTVNHRRAGRPAIAVDWERVGEYLRKGLPLADVAALHRCHEDTLRAHAEAEGIDISSLVAAKRAEGRDRLLDQMHAHSERWGPMAIFLSKQREWLGYSDTPPPPPSAESQALAGMVQQIFARLLDLGSQPQPAIEGQVRELPPATAADPIRGVQPDGVQE